MNKQGPSGISWTDWTWNPVRGLCPVNCKTPDGHEYCYARKIYKRFNLMDMLYAEIPDRDFDLTLETIILDETELEKPYSLSKPILQKSKKVFVCSTIELFHQKIPKEFRDSIFNVIEENQQVIFQILTKMPENIDRPMPDNVWLGVSITDGMEMYRWPEIKDKTTARIKFVSYEPIIDEIPFFPKDCSWVIMGRLTGYGRKYDPKREYIEKFVKWSKESNTPVFLKNNLKSIWGENLIQEFPE